MKNHNLSSSLLKIQLLSLNGQLDTLNMIALDGDMTISTHEHNERAQVWHIAPAKGRYFWTIGEIKRSCARSPRNTLPLAALAAMPRRTAGRPVSTAPVPNTD